MSRDARGQGTISQEQAELDVPVERRLGEVRRRDEHSFVINVFNFTPVPRYDYRVGVPVEGQYQELLNSDSSYYSGSDVGNSGQISSEPIPCNGRPHSLSLTLPPLAGVVLKIQPHSS